MNSPKDIAKNYIDIGVGKMNLSVLKMILLGIMAGAFIAFAGFGATVASATIENASVAKFVGACAFPAGLAMVLIAGSELFTGNCLLVIPVLEKKATVAKMLKSWLFVYIGNLIGSIIVGALVAGGHSMSLFSNAVAKSVINTAVTKVSMSFGDALIRGILCNFLVCIAVWMSFAAKDVAGKIVGLFFPIMIFVVSGFEHSIANMYYVSAGLFGKMNDAFAAAATADTSVLTWGAMFGKNLLPVTIGNIIGGAVCVGLLYWVVYLKDSSK